MMNDDVPFYEYMGNGQRVPKDVVRVRFHPSVIEVDESAFHRCRSLREVVLNEGLKTIGRSSFLGCSLESIIIPSTVTNIGKSAFQACNSLREINLDEGLVNVGYYAFCLCTSLESITIPSSVTDIGSYAFGRCKNLREVVCIEGLLRIGVGAFEKCSSLQSIFLPSSVEEIGFMAFYGCTDLREVVFVEGVPKIKHDAFHGCPVFERITFPCISSRLDAIIQAGLVDLQSKIQQYINRGDIEIEWEGGGTIYIPVEVTRRRDGWDLVQQHVRQIVKWIKYYEMKEATTLFELALWKAKIDQVEDGIYERGRGFMSG